MTPQKNRYFYMMQILRVIDGDTYDVRVDLGFRITTWQRVRLMGVNTPEIKGAEKPEGLKVKAYVETLLLGKTVLAETFKQGKYGRYLVDITLEDGQQLSSHLVERGMARKVNY